MSTPVFYGSLSSPETVTVFFSLFCVVRRKEENHRVEPGVGPLSLSLKAVSSQLSSGQHLLRQTWLWITSVKTRGDFPFILFFVLRAWLCGQWGYTFWSPSAGRCSAGLALVAKHPGILRHKFASSVLVVPAQRGICQKGSQTQRDCQL